MEEKSAIVEARKRAERAVADMPEGDLRLKAFEVILNRLLSAAEGATASSRRKRGGRHRGTEGRTERNSGGGTQGGAVPVSTPARRLALKGEGFFTEQRGIGVDTGTAPPWVPPPEF